MTSITIFISWKSFQGGNDEKFIRHQSQLKNHFILQSNTALGGKM